MQEATFADVDADVVDATAVTEEDKIAGDQLRTVRDHLTLSGHVTRDAWQLDAESIAENPTDQARTIEAGWRGAAPTIRRTQHGGGAHEDGFDFVRLNWLIRVEILDFLTQGRGLRRGDPGLDAGRCRLHGRIGEVQGAIQNAHVIG